MSVFRIFGGSKDKNNGKSNGNKKEEQKQSNEIDKYLNDLTATKRKTVSILLLGPGGSGKSTVLKQMEAIYRGKINKRNLKNAVESIRQNIIEDIHDLATQNTVLKATHAECVLGPAAHAIAARIMAIKLGSLQTIELTPQLAQEIYTLWKDPGLQATFDIRRRSHIMDNVGYFFEHLTRIAQPDYVTTFEDYVRVRNRTTGIIEADFDVSMDATSKNKWKLKVTDVGGQRTERKKWLRCFNDINAVIYVMSLAAYDQSLFEDNNQNCYREALDVFAQTAKHAALSEVDFIIFLNKNDLFLPKIKLVPFSVFEPNFDPDKVHDEKAVKEYLTKQFRSRFYGDKADAKQNQTRRIHFHVTCATDTNQIQTVMSLIQFETVRKMLRVGMLMG